MTDLNKNFLPAAFFTFAGALVAAPATAQSLALSYKLNNAEAESAKQALIAINRCSGFNWITSLGACGKELLSRVSAPAHAESDNVPKASEPVREVTHKPDVAPPRAQTASIVDESVQQLPTLGVPVTSSVIRNGGGKESLLGNAKNVDLVFRFGSKYRFRSSDEGWEWYRFTEAGYDTRMQMNAHKSAGIELLVPLQ